MTHNIIIRHLVFPCIPGRGRRPRRPAFPLASPCARRAGDVAPYHNNMVGIMWYPCVPVYPGRGRRPRRPASPLASPLASPCARRAVDVAPYHNNMVGIIRHLVFPCIPNNMVGIMWHLVFPCIPGGADVPGGPRPRWRLRWHPRVRVAPEASRPTIITWLASCGTLCSRVFLP